MQMSECITHLKTTTDMKPVQWSMAPCSPVRDPPPPFSPHRCMETGGASSPSVLSHMDITKYAVSQLIPLFVFRQNATNKEALLWKDSSQSLVFDLCSFTFAMFRYNMGRYSWVGKCAGLACEKSPVQDYKCWDACRMCAWLSRINSSLCTKVARKTT